MAHTADPLAPAHAADPPVKLFYALWPDAATRAALARLPLPAGGRRMPEDQLHLTLAFLGMQPAALVPQLATVLDALPFAPIQMTIDRFGVFERPRIVCAGMDPPAALPDLRRDLLQALLAVSPKLAVTGRFTPHVTLMRNLPQGKQPEALVQPIAWLADRMTLVASIPAAIGTTYRVLSSRTSADSRIP
jgi:2'-5' RNA ligase